MILYQLFHLIFWIQTGQVNGETIFQKEIPYHLIEGSRLIHTNRRLPEGEQVIRVPLEGRFKLGLTQSPAMPYIIDCWIEDVDFISTFEPDYRIFGIGYYFEDDDRWFGPPNIAAMGFWVNIEPSDLGFIRLGQNQEIDLYSITEVRFPRIDQTTFINRLELDQFTMRIIAVPDAQAAVEFFLRGDVNADGERDLADPLALIFYLIRADSNPTCLDALDANDDGKLDFGDVIFGLNAIFKVGSPFYALPSDFCGFDTSDDDALGCEGQRLCMGGE